MIFYYLHPGLATGLNNGLTEADAFRTWAACASHLNTNHANFVTDQQAVKVWLIGQVAPLSSGVTFSSVTSEAYPLIFEVPQSLRSPGIFDLTKPGIDILSSGTILFTGTPTIGVQVEGLQITGNQTKTTFAVDVPNTGRADFVFRNNYVKDRQNTGPGTTDGAAMLNLVWPSDNLQGSLISHNNIFENFVGVEPNAQMVYRWPYHSHLPSSGFSFRSSNDIFINIPTIVAQVGGTTSYLNGIWLNARRNSSGGRVAAVTASLSGYNITNWAYSTTASLAGHTDLPGPVGNLYEVDIEGEVFVSPTNRNLKASNNYGIGPANADTVRGSLVPQYDMHGAERTGTTTDVGATLFGGVAVPTFIIDPQGVNVRASAAVNVIQVGDWKLAEGYFVEAKMPMRVVHPRSLPVVDGGDTTSSWARHKFAYPGIEYRIPISIQGGAYPFYYELLDGPAWLSIDGTIWENQYGVLRGVAPATPQAAETVRVKITDQQLVEKIVEFPLTVTTDNFIFVDVNAATSGDGSIGSPLKLFSELHGGYYPGSGSLGNAGTSAYSGKRVYLRGGVHQVADIPTPYISWSGRPQVLLGYPGENVELQHTNGQIRSTTADFFFGGITSRYGPNLNLVEGGHWSEAAGRTGGSSSWLYAYDNSWEMENGNRPFALGGGGRVTFFEWTMIQHRGGFNNTHPSLGSARNESVIYSSAYGAGSYRNYVTVWDVKIQDQSHSLIQLYSTRYGVAEKVVILPNSGGPFTTTASALLYLKSQNPFWSVRRNIFTEHALNLSGGGGLYLNMSNRSGHTDSMYNEAAYNVIHSVGDSRGRTINYNQSGLPLESYADDHTLWMYRNTFIGSMHGLGRPYTLYFEGNVLVLGAGASSSHAEGEYPVSTATRPVIVGIEGLIGPPSALDTFLDADYKLKGTYREQHLGRVGHEIPNGGA